MKITRTHIFTTVYNHVLIHTVLSELEQWRVKTLAQGFNTAVQDSNMGPLRQTFDALPLSHYAISVSPVSIWNIKEEDVKHPGSDPPKCQHRKVGLVKMF